MVLTGVWSLTVRCYGRTPPARERWDRNILSREQTRRRRGKSRRRRVIIAPVNSPWSGLGSVHLSQGFVDVSRTVEGILVGLILYNFALSPTKFQRRIMLN